MKYNSINVILGLALITSSVFADALPVRMKDVGKMFEARENQLVGYGLVVGLRGTGDSRQTSFTESSLTNVLRKMGVASSSQSYGSRNVASVMVTASLPPFVRKGQRIPVTVSSLGDATSLSGGTLVITPLLGPDMNVYAVAQGNVLVGGLNETSAQSRYARNQSNSGTVPGGAIVEDEVPVTMSDLHHITFVLDSPNFVTAARAIQALQGAGFKGAKAIDAAMIKIPLSDLDSTDLVSAIAQIENISFTPDSSGKVVIDSRSGTIVIGEMVRLAPVALTYGNISVRVTESTGGAAVAPAGAGQQAAAPDAIRVEEPDNKFIYLNPSSTLSSLVNSLNEIGASPRDMISIIQALKESGSLVADVEVI
ncbi:flagellar basal body P-ring protein FlgI [bacterium]|nr:flagellar basal body P-ring protein FlgI [bacterium]